MVVFSLVSTAIVTLLFGADNANRYVTNEATAMWEADLVWHRMAANGMAAIPVGSGGMTPTVTTDANGQSRLTFIVPDLANSTTRTLKYYCTGASAPYTLVEDDPRYDVSGTPNAIAHNVTGFTVTLDSTTSMKIWTTLTVQPANCWTVTRHFCAQCRNF